MGYGNAYHAHDAAELAMLIANGFDSGRLTFVYLRIAGGTKENLGRPGKKPPEIRERFMRFVAKSTRPAGARQ